MASNPIADTTTYETLTLADIDAAIGQNPDPTGDFAAGRTHFHPTTDDFLACFASQPHESPDN